MKVILAALAGAAITASATALAGTTASRPVTQAQLVALTRRVATLERRTACLATEYNDQSAEPYLVQGWGGFDSKSGFVDLFQAPSADDGLNATGYLVTIPKPITAYTKC